MDSLEIVEVKLNIEHFLDTKISNGLPLETVRMLLAEITLKYNQRLTDELNRLLAERENGNANE